VRAFFGLGSLNGFPDQEGNRTQVIDRDGLSTSHQYDARQRLIQTTDPLRHAETYSYDGNDNRLSPTDRNSHTTGYGYDLQNRQNQLTDALDDVTMTVYDGVGRVISVTGANGHDILQL
jgi:YD repeat-containing protein